MISLYKSWTEYLDNEINVSKEKEERQGGRKHSEEGGSREEERGRRKGGNMEGEKDARGRTKWRGVYYFISLAIKIYILAYFWF